MSSPPSKRVKKEPVLKEKCYVCGRFVINIATHLTSHSPKSKFPYHCRYCRSVFKTEEMQIEHVQNHKDIDCSICSNKIEIARIDRHMDNHKKENEQFIQRQTGSLSEGSKNKVHEQKKSDYGVQQIPKPTKTPNQPNSKIPDCELLFCPTCQIEWPASDAAGLQSHIQSKHQEKPKPDSSKPKIKKKPPTKAEVEESNRLLYQQNLQLSTQLDDERRGKNQQIGQLKELNRQYCDLNEKHLKQTEELAQVKKELAEMKAAKERISSVDSNSNKRLENNQKEMCQDLPVIVQEAIQKEHVSIDINETVHEREEENSPQNRESQAGPSSSMPEPILSNLESENQENVPPVHEKIQNTTPVGNICTTCGNKYTTVKILKRHMKYHTASDQFSCPDCDKTFSRSDRLKDHSVVHTGEKPYTCLMCPRKFSGSKAWNRHMQNQSCGK